MKNRVEDYVWYKRFDKILKNIESNDIKETMQLIYKYLNFGSFGSDRQAKFARIALDQLMKNHQLEKDLDEVQASGSTWEKGLQSERVIHARK